MKLPKILVALFTLALALSLSFARRVEAAVSVVTTTSTLAAIAREVGGADVEVKALALPTQDPHFVDAKPSLALVLNHADLLVVNGLDLEVGWLPVLQQGARNPKIQVGGEGYLDASSAVGVLDVPGAVSRAQGDIHPGGNPHYLYDPRAGAKVAKAIAARLAKVDPAHMEDYIRRAAALEKRAQALSLKLFTQFAGLEPARRKIVVYHKSWTYLSAWLGLAEVGAVEPKPGIPPDPGHVAQLMGTMKSLGVKAILEEDFYPQTTSNLLASKTGAELVVAAGGAGGSQAYLDYVQGITTKLYAALSK